jgi:hypothetical protein
VLIISGNGAEDVSSIVVAVDSIVIAIETRSYESPLHLQHLAVEVVSR